MQYKEGSKNKGSDCIPVCKSSSNIKENDQMEIKKINFIYIITNGIF